MQNTPKALVEYMIRKAEKLYGKKVGYPLNDVIIMPSKNYAQTLVDEDKGDLKVSLTTYLTNKNPQTVYQAAHEAVHCLFPVQRMDTLYLEEGLAIEFALNTVGEINHKYAAESLKELRSPWLEAYNSYLKLNPASYKIRKLRIDSPWLDQVTIKQIETHLDASPAVASELVRRLPKSR